MQERYRIPNELDDALAQPRGTKKPGWKLLEECCVVRGKDRLKAGLGYWSRNGLKAVHTGDGVIAMKSHVDFTGSVTLGFDDDVGSTCAHAIHFDCKKCAGPSLKLHEANFHGKQKKKLLDHSDAGATCFLLVHFNRRKLRTKSEPAETFAVPVTRNHEFWVANERGQVGMLSRENAAKYGVRVSWSELKGQRTLRPDIINAVLALRALPIPEHEEGEAPW